MSTQDQRISPGRGQLTRPAWESTAEESRANEGHSLPTSYSREETKRVLEPPSPDHRGAFVTLSPVTCIDEPGEESRLLSQITSHVHPVYMGKSLLCRQGPQFCLRDEEFLFNL